MRLEIMEGFKKCLILNLSGYVDTYNTDSFQKRVKKAINHGFVTLLFNCSKLSYFSSTGIGSFTTFLKTVKPLGGDIILFGLHPRLDEIFRLLGFSQFFAIKNTREEAILYVKNYQRVRKMTFPRIIECPLCERRLRAVKAGTFRCSQCKSVLVISGTGSVELGFH